MLPRIQTASDSPHLETEFGQPFLWLADTAWELLQRLRPEEIQHYLELRAAQGFNVVQVVALTELGELRANALGETPLIDLDPLRPNPAFFALLDSVLERAAALGMYVALLPTWGDKLTPNWGAGPVVFDAANAFGYASWLALRYRECPNLIWMLGGDRPAVFERDGAQFDHRPIWREMARGILEATGGRALLLYHPPGGGELRTALSLHGEPWLMVNAMQSGHGGGHDQPVWDWIGQDLARAPHKPVLDLEPNYEDHPVNPWPSFDPANGYFRDHDVRKQLWRGLLAGACGMTYGHHAVWQFYAPGREVINHADRTWFEAMQRPGAVQAGVMRRCLEAFLPRSWPAQELLASGVGEGASHVRAARNEGWSRALVYVPNTQVIRLRLEKFAVSTGQVLAGQVFAGQVFAGQILARWFDPRTGYEQTVGVFKAEGERLFATPTDGPDWVLMLEAVGFS